jgi:50S ribosomal protein L16 3-hydroxylase
MEPTQALSLLGGLSPAQFMRRHWQKKPLLVRQAIANMQPLLSAPQLFALAARAEVESRLIERSGRKGQSWMLRRGPFARRALPALATPGWTLLVQGVDLHHQGVHDLLQRFRFIPDARLDDLMISYASAEGGVGPHFDSYDVFLLQASGSRRWQIGAQRDLSLREDAPLKILRDFQPQQEFVLHAGDMLYLPPRYAHDGVAVPCQDERGRSQPCMTYSIGFRAPSRQELASALLVRMAESDSDSSIETPVLYRDPGQQACDTPAAIPARLREFAQASLERALREPAALDRALGQYLSEPKPSVWFEAGEPSWTPQQGLRLHPCTRMLYDERHVFINGECLLASGRDARLMRQLADNRRLEGRSIQAASEQARQMLAQWLEDGWLELS